MPETLLFLIFLSVSFQLELFDRCVLRTGKATLTFLILSLVLPLSCGKSPVSRVIGGVDATPGNWPWQVRLY